MTCSCGMEVPTEAASKEEAVKKITEMMMPAGSMDGIAKHMKEEPKHANDPMPTAEQAMAMIEANTAEVVEA